MKQFIHRCGIARDKKQGLFWDVLAKRWLVSKRRLDAYPGIVKIKQF